MLQRSVSLEAAVNDQEYSNFCAEKAENSTDESEKSVWEFLRVRCINLRYRPYMDWFCVAGDF